MTDTNLNVEGFGIATGGLDTAARAKTDAFKDSDEWWRDAVCLEDFSECISAYVVKISLKSMKLTINGFLYSKLCSTTFLKVNICSLYDGLGQNPVCSFRRILSTAVLSRLSSTTQNTLPGTECRVMSL